MRKRGSFRRPDTRPPLRSKTLLVCGGRNFGEVGRPDAVSERHFVYDVLKELWISRGMRRLVHGGCRGADKIADRAAAGLGYDVVAVPAEWEVWGRAAGPIRNAVMLHQERPSVIVAFPGGRGTTGMLRLAARAGLECLDRRNWSPQDAHRNANKQEGRP